MLVPPLFHSVEDRFVQCRAPARQVARGILRLTIRWWGYRPGAEYITGPLHPFPPAPARETPGGPAGGSELALAPAPWKDSLHALPSRTLSRDRRARFRTRRGVHPDRRGGGARRARRGGGRR